MLICLHVGAHKTASTYMQSRLMEDGDVLSGFGIGVASHVDFRKEVTEALDAASRLGAVGHAVARPALRRSLARLVEAHAAHDRLIVSDENVAGSILSAVGRDGLYPQIKARLGALLAALPEGHDAKVFFCVRGYAEYFSSIFAYRAGQRHAQDIDEFRRRAMTLRRGWVEVVSDIVAVAGADRTVVWPYETFKKAPARIGAELLGEGPPKIFVRTHKAILPSLSRKGLMVLDHVGDLLSEAEYAGLARQLAQISFDKPDGKITLFDAEEAASLAERYDRDLAAIGALGCCLLVHGADADASPVAVD
ncbi:hypothetical protein [Methylopila sp. M107]|uniref:hypothetical protein n=1 Tax=Methylopila sp. M107 TaxID=1101190 RepID=UPI000376DCEC|nr:hypothetical protein [Methylopila sp. M107]